MYPVETKLLGLPGTQGVPFSKVLCVAAKVRGEKNLWLSKCHPEFVQLIEHKRALQSGKQKASHFYLKTDKGIQECQDHLYYLVSLIRVSGQRKQHAYGVHYMMGKDNRGLGKSNRWVEPYGSHLLSTENVFILSSLMKMVISLLSKILFFFFPVSVATAVELIISFNRPDRNTRIFLLMKIIV